ncbi:MULTISPECIES: hypothetical protein [Bradyrhizobium]|uniref:hypothetical protein n=1 Tax=Bradyrhizobium TaxID=374 RepID=UPI0010088459|nr:MULTISPECIES: hypothetical protein [Bradyrhizobium]MDA9399710.1 hypothetical protein [Bradyrhizobium sp. CCBAU 45389]MDA9531384.1 hypothetical protein [Bradyrhizobium sp. CCBAU 25338]RXH32315.1 hypothetical protein XH84_14015 [Bradyrhizobium nanningense]
MLHESARPPTRPRIVDCFVVAGIPPEQLVARMQELEAEKIMVAAGLESAKEGDNIIALPPRRSTATSAPLWNWLQS